VQNHDESNVFANERQHSEQPESINDTYVLEKDDSNVIPDSSNIYDMFTKALPEDRFKYLVRRIGMRCLTP
ncbi:hypothetical protein Tco_0379947, partial [Tanacetum coccineum]